MNLYDFEKMMRNEPAEINAKIIDVAGNTEIEILGRGIDLIVLSMQIAIDVMQKLHTDVDVYCNTLKKAINNCSVDLKPDEKTESRPISTDSKLMAQVISLITSYAIENKMSPNETIKTVAENMLSLLKIATFENWEKKEDLDDK